MRPIIARGSASEGTAGEHAGVIAEAHGHNVDDNIDDDDVNANIVCNGKKGPKANAAAGPRRLVITRPDNTSSVRVSQGLPEGLSRLLDGLDSILPVGEGETAHFRFDALGNVEAELLSVAGGAGPSGTSTASQPATQPSGAKGKRPVPCTVVTNSEESDETDSQETTSLADEEDDHSVKGQASPSKAVFTRKGKGPAPTWHQGSTIGEADPWASSMLPRMGFFPTEKGKNNSTATPRVDFGQDASLDNVERLQRSLFPTTRVSMDNVYQDNYISDILELFPAPSSMSNMEHNNLAKQPQHAVAKQPQNTAAKQGRNATTKQPQDTAAKQGQNATTKQSQDIAAKQSQNVTTTQPQNTIAKQGQNGVWEKPQNTVAKQPQNAATKIAAAEHASSHPAKNPHLRSTKNLVNSEHAEATFKPLMTNDSAVEAPEEAPKAAPSLSGPSKLQPTKRAQAAIKAIDNGCKSTKFEQSVETIIQGYIKTAKAGGSGREYLETEVHAYLANKEGKSKQAPQEASDEKTAVPTAAEPIVSTENTSAATCEDKPGDCMCSSCLDNVSDEAGEKAVAASAGNVGPFKPMARKGKYPAGLVEPYKLKTPMALERNVDPTIGGASTVEDDAGGPAADADSLPAPKKTRKRKGHRGKKRSGAKEACTADFDLDAFSPTPLTDYLLRTRMAVYKDMKEEAGESGSVPSGRGRNDPSFMLEYLKMLRERRMRDQAEKEEE
ncbi:hypothetical protein B0H67DRAFT_685149 [Lasiosphaeris hirsuta]|uniref:Uncharacterized protein n=1 Tax=Lasiosphaeris hirsuta TaxID=260670 RepID=A0AA40A926_9PEZI|nr:hypothetical protein B0H67DRAFT_685149 [Lasiosphaeris hirsuta]